MSESATFEKKRLDDRDDDDVVIILFFLASDANVEGFGTVNSGSCQQFDDLRGDLHDAAALRQLAARSGDAIPPRSTWRSCNFIQGLCRTQGLSAPRNRELDGRQPRELSVSATPLVHQAFSK